MKKSCLLTTSGRVVVIRIMSLVLCYTIVAPAFGGWRFRNVSNRSASQQRPRPSSSPKPSPTGNGSKGQATPSPYVPAALRTDNSLVRSQGGRATAVIPAPGKQRAPLSNLPNLAESRKRRQAPATKRNNKDKGGSSKTDSAAFRQVEMACGDCDPTGGGGVVGNTNDPYFGEARTEPINETGDPGVTLGSQNFNWSLPLISLPGRAGLDLSLTLYYNSLVWVKQGSAILYNADHGTPAPGFQLGLPRLQDPFLDTNGTTTTSDDFYAYMLITPSGGRVQLKQIGSTSIYESTDGSYIQLTVSGSTRIVTTTDGTQLIFGTHVSPEWRCTRIEDRNGNYISATYDSSTGHASTITDTLGRSLTFHYDGDGNLSYISQPWESGTRDFVSFVYKSQTMSPSFSGVTPYGAGSSQTVLDYVVFDDNTSYHFDYNAYGQVYQIRHKAPDGHPLEYVFYNLDNPGTQTDCPRFTERHDWAQDWLPGTQEAVTHYEVTTNATWTNPDTSATETGTMVKQTAPDNTSYKQYSHASGWDTGLPRLAEFLDADGVKKKWISTTWTQDSESLTYQQNPRVIETNIYDDASNRRRTTVAYDVGYNLPTTVSEYAVNGTTVLRSTLMSYKDDSAYLDRRIIGLPFQRAVADGSGHIAAKQEFQYDQGDAFFVTDQPSTNYDDTNYPSWFRVGRGNLTSVLRFDCTSNSTADNSNLAITTQRMGYNLAGSVVWTADASDHTTTISYGDSFSDNNNSRGTLAYATTVTDADGFSSGAQYNFDFGGITNTHVPTSGLSPITYLDVTRTYDDFGRILKIENQSDHSYTRVDYETSANYIHTYQTIIGVTQGDEFHSWKIFDGAGRVRAVASDHPGSSGGYSGQYTVYDKMTRVIEQSNPTEFAINGTTWVVAGDDVSVGWHSTSQDYDWKGRPHQTTNPDGTTRVITYGGCGCAGGEVTIVQDEHSPRRERRYTKDALGRLTTVQEMIWNTATAYSTTTYGYNTRDQIETINQAGQQRTFSYDGHGRLQQRITPEQGTTTYSYNPDDTTLVMTDARSVTTTYEYNHRHQVTLLTYNVAGDPTLQTAATANASFTYDAAGNRTSMTDGLGSASYAFNNLGQLYSETRTLTGVGSYALNYEYNYTGELKKITDFRNVQVTYGYDKAGRLSSVGGANYGNVSSYASNLAYRAFGAIKSMTFGDGPSGQGHTLSTAYDVNLRPTTWKVTGVLGFNYQYDGYYHERTGRVIYAENTASSGGADSSLDRSYEYDAVGRLAVSHSGAEARAHVLNGQWGTTDGPYSLGFEYDVWGNLTHRYGWGGEVQGDNATHTPPEQSFTYSGNKRTDFTYDAAGNLKNDGIQTYAYDATGQQTSATWSAASYTPSFTDDPLNPNGTHTDIKLVHLTELRAEVNKLRVRAGLSAVTNWSPDPNPQTNVTYVHHSHIVQLRAKLGEAYNALHFSIGAYEHSGPNTDDIIYAIDFQELRTKIKNAWAALSSSSSVITQSYDGNGLRVKKNEYGNVTFYLRSTVLGGQVVAELNASGNWQREYVYAGSSLLAVQQDGVFWMHEDPITKSKRVTDVNGYTVSAIELDPWGADTNASWAQAFQPRKYTSYERDLNGGDDAMFRRYNRKHARFDQPDPYEGSYDFTDPQSFNRYAYTRNDPTNFVDHTGLLPMMCGLYDQYMNGDHTGLGLVCFGTILPTDWYNGPKDPFIPDPEPGDPPPPDKKTPYVDPDVLASCVEMLFGVTMTSFKQTERGRAGSFTGTGFDVINNWNGSPTSYTVYNNVTRYSSADLKKGTGKERVTGMTVGGYPWTNYTANDLKSMMEVLKTQVHELGHSLDEITGIRYEDKTDDGKTGFRLGQTKGQPIEAGWKLEGCVAQYGGFKYK